MFNVHADVVCDAACATHCWHCNSAGAGLCDANQCKPTYTVAEDKTCQRESVKPVLISGASPVLSPVHT